MKAWAELIGAIAALLWPLFAFTLLLVFRREIKRVIGRIKRGKFLGQEIELEESLTQLEKSANAAAMEVGALPAATGSTDVTTHLDTSAAQMKILEESARSPKAALLLLASEIEREVREVIASMGLHEGRQFITLRQGLEILRQREALPTHVGDSVRLFWNVRNRLVHGHQTTDDDILRAIDSGTTILKAIQAIPQEVNVVRNPGVDIYSDPELTHRIEGAKGVILETASPGGAIKSLRIYPTTRTHFQKGMRVAWEWNKERTFDATWYRDPDSGQVRQAWSSSMEFIGRNMDSL